MTYFVVKAESDQTRLPGKSYGILIKNELKTKKELDRLGVSDAFINRHFDRHDISQKKTYFFFGARFYNKY